MNVVRKILTFVAALAFAGLVLPTFAAQPQKIFTLTMSPAVVSSSPTTLTATYTNLTPNGNATVGTLILVPPSGVSVSSPVLNGAVTSTTPPSGGTRVSCPATIQDSSGATIPVPAGSLCISGIPTVLKAGCTPAACTWHMDLNVSLSGATNSCTSYNFGAYAFTGNSFNGDTFALLTTVAQYNPTVKFGSGSNTSSFSTPPQNTVVGNIIPPPAQVTLATPCGPAPNGTAVTISAVNTFTNASCTTGTGCLSNPGNVANTTGGIATFSSLKINTPGTYTLTASATGYPDAVAPVAITIFEGTLGCGGTLNQSFTNPNNLQDFQPGFVTGSRGNFNKGNATCVLVPYSFTNSILSPDPITGQDNTVRLNWDPSVDPHAVFTYTVNWKARNIDTSSTTSGWHTCPNGAGGPCRPNVAWLNNDGSPASSPGVPSFVPGLACLGTNPPNNMPAPYGKLTAGIAGNPNPNTSISIDTTGALVPLPPAASLPWPIVVDNERMDITAISGSGNLYSLTVTRGTGMSSISAHLANALAMSTPMPIIPAVIPFTGFSASFATYQPGHVAEICVNENGFAAYGNGQVYDFSTIIDQDGDGWVGGP